MSAPFGRVECNFMASHGLRLLARGYDITSIVTGHKYPVRGRWQEDKVGIRHDAWRATQGDPPSGQQVINWSKEPGITGVGVFGRNVCGVDLDISCPRLSAILQKYVEELVGVGVRRIGRAPRILLVYRCDGSIQHPPTTKYIDPDDLTADEQGIDFMSGEGRQFVANAHHPDTKKPYYYDGPELADTDLVDLFPITREQCALIAAKFESLVAELGWEPVKRSNKSKAADASPALHRDPDDTLLVDPKFGASLADLGEMLSCLDPDMEGGDFDTVFKAACEEFDGSDGCRLALLEWAKSGAKWADSGIGPFTSRWNRAKQGNGTGRKATLRTMQHWINTGENLHPDYEPPADLGVSTGEPTDFGVVEDGGAPKWNCGPTPFVFRDLELIPPRRFLYGRDYARGFVSVLASPGGVGKTSLQVVEALAMVTGRPLLGETVHERVNVFIVNLEDDMDEMERRVRAAMLYYGIPQSEVEGRLFMRAGRDINMVFGKQTRDVVTLNTPMTAFLAAEFRRLDIGCALVDPWVSAHQVPEKDNDGVDAVAKLAGKLASDAGCSICLVHHTRKTNGEETTIDDIRGGGALVNAARFARTITRIKPEDAIKLGADPRQGLFAVTDGKANLSPPAHKRVMCRTVGVDLPNGIASAWWLRSRLRPMLTTSTITTRTRLYPQYRTP